MKRPLMGAACAKLADKLVVTSDNPRSEDPLKIIDAILAGIDVAASSADSATKVEAVSRPLVKKENIHIEPDRRAAIHYALANAADGDVVVIAGKGHETTQEIKGVKYPFDDREKVSHFAPLPSRGDL